jgi:hypothetical protein
MIHGQQNIKNVRRIKYVFHSSNEIRGAKRRWTWSVNVLLLCLACTLGNIPDIYVLVFYLMNNNNNNNNNNIILWKDDGGEIVLKRLLK